MLNEKPTETTAQAEAEYAARVTRPACVCGHTPFEHADANGKCVHVETDGADRWPGDCTCSGYTATDPYARPATDRRDYARFVAAFRWLRANGYNVNGDNREKRIGISIGNWGEPDFYLDVKALTEYGNWANDILSTRPTSVAQAIDFLVVAGILPAQFGSWAISEGKHNAVFAAVYDLIAKPECSCHYVDIGVGSQKAAEDPACVRCTPDGLTDAIMGVFAQAVAR